MWKFGGRVNLCTDSKFALAPTGAVETFYLQDLQIYGVLYPEFPREIKQQSLSLTVVLISMKIAYSERELRRKHLMECVKCIAVYYSACWLSVAMVKVKKSHYRPGVAQMVPGS